MLITSADTFFISLNFDEFELSRSESTLERAMSNQLPIGGAENLETMASAMTDVTAVMVAANFII